MAAGVDASIVEPNRSESASPIQPSLYQPHLNNSSNSTTPSPAPSHQQSFETQLIATETILSPSQSVPPMNLATVTSHTILPSQSPDASISVANAVTSTIAAPLTTNNVNGTTNLSGNGSGENKSTYSSLLGNNNCMSYLASTASTTNANRSSLNTASNTTTFDYLYEFSETRKVLEDFFKNANNDDDKKIVDCFNESDTGSYVSITQSTLL